MRLSGWGRFRAFDCTVATPANKSELAALIGDAPVIARGNGRSYGDCATAAGTTVRMSGFARIVSFDEDEDILVCEGGVLLADILALLLPRGRMPLAMPGTKYVTVGGMIAADVHGKNQHATGSFGHHVEWLDLLTADGACIRCSRDEETDLFRATIGGMGLTGMVLRAALRVTRVTSSYFRRDTILASGWEQTVDRLEEAHHRSHVVAWLDCHAPRARYARGVIQCADPAHADDLPRTLAADPIRFDTRAPRTLPPVPLPRLLNRATIKAHNAYYWAKAAHGRSSGYDDADTFLFPLDGIADWNRLYGPAGFLQHQCVLPRDRVRPGLKRLFATLAESAPQPYLVTMKYLSDGAGLLSFPMDGLTVALDFPTTPAVLDLLDRLDRIAADEGGRVYLAKDARMTRAAFAPMYAGLDRFAALRHDLGYDRLFRSHLSDRLEL